MLVDELAADDVTRLLRHRASEAKWLAKTQRAAAARRRTRFAAMTQPGPLVATTNHTAVERAHQGDEALRRAASRTLVDHGPVPARMRRLDNLNLNGDGGAAVQDEKAGLANGADR